MPTFRIRTQDGREHAVEAARIRADATSAYAETPTIGGWWIVMSLPLRDVDRIQRRLDEPDGRWTWMTERISH